MEDKNSFFSIEYLDVSTIKSAGQTLEEIQQWILTNN